MDWDDERVPQSELAAKEIELFRETVRRVKSTMPFYAERLRDVDPDAIRTPEDIALVPTTNKADLRAQPYPSAIGVPLTDVMELHASSGTTGSAVVTGYTASDLQLWRTAMKRVLQRAGVHRGDIVHNAYGYGLFTGGLGFHYAALETGVTVLPISGGQTQRQVTMLRDLKATVLTCTPSYGQHIAEVMRQMGVAKDEMSLRVGIFGAEAWSQQMCDEIESEMGITALDVYGLAEIIGPGVASECAEGHKGLHVSEDLFYFEVIDPQTGKPVPDGTLGELVLTALRREASPVVRYRTGDITRVIPGSCECGRTTRRMDHILGRVDDMFTLRGVNLFPRDVESALLDMDALAPVYQLVLDRHQALDVLEVHVEPRETEAEREVLAAAVQRRLNEVLGVSVMVAVMDPLSIPRSEGKAVRVVDRRKLTYAR